MWIFSRQRKLGGYLVKTCTRSASTMAVQCSRSLVECRWGVHPLSITSQTSSRAGVFQWKIVRFGNSASKRCGELRSPFSTAELHEDHDEEDPSASIIPFILADIGEGIAEVELIQWFVQEGDKVQQFDRICEVQSDKATVEITSRYDGYIAKIEHGKGEMIKVGSPLLFLKKIEDGQIPTDANSHASLPDRTHCSEHQGQKPVVEVPENVAPHDHVPRHDDSYKYHDIHDIPAFGGARSLNVSPANAKIMTTPAIRKLAKEHSLDLYSIAGSGPKGRVLKGDVLKVLRDRGLLQHDNHIEVNEGANLGSHGHSDEKSPPIATGFDQIDLPLHRDTTVEIRGYSRLMVQSMTASLEIPHMVYADEIDVTALRVKYKSDLPFLPYCIKALSVALASFPLLNASLDAKASQIKLWADHNIGVAMDTPRGLVVPVIKQVQKKSMTEVVQELGRLKEHAMQNSLGAEDLQGATFTLSNIGAIGGGGTYMSPIIVSPQVAIGALGKVQRVPRFASNDSTQVHEAYVINVSWAGDHRVVDGATMARFHQKWKTLLEEPVQMIQNLR